ncbi:MAG TPA: hypothetical protein VGP68_08935 [Gemmataceae bacterium]|nr:hypothetical protein [Gemmataceae bacterium]
MLPEGLPSLAGEDDEEPPPAPNEPIPLAAGPPAPLPPVPDALDPPAVEPAAEVDVPPLPGTTPVVEPAAAIPPSGVLLAWDEAAAAFDAPLPGDVPPPDDEPLPVPSLACEGRADATPAPLGEPLAPVDDPLVRPELSPGPSSELIVGLTVPAEVDPPDEAADPFAADKPPLPPAKEFVCPDCDP